YSQHLPQEKYHKVNLSPELLLEIFQYIENDYNSLYKCVQVNKYWHNFSIPILWWNPFYSYKSVRILINCLLAEDKDFLTMERKNKAKNSCIYKDEDDNDIKIWFKQLKKPPLHNYAKYTTELDVTPTFAIGNMFEIPNYFKFKAFVEYLVEFILDHSSIIKKVCMVHLDDGWLF